jgi:hypothetical protein
MTLAPMKQFLAVCKKYTGSIEDSISGFCSLIGKIIKAGFYELAPLYHKTFHGQNSWIFVIS